MSKGIAKVELLGSASQVMQDDVPNWDFLYAVSTVRDSKHNIGDRVVTPDGRVFRYALAAGTCNPEVGAYNPIKTFTVAVAPAQTALGTAGLPGYQSVGAVGDRLVRMTVAATDGALGTGVVAADELRGGYVVIGNGSAQHPQMRCILGNSAVAANGGSCLLYLDAALVTAVTVGTTTIETFINPYAAMKGDNAGGSYVTFLGIPAARATVGQYFWLQTWGVCWITSNSNTCNSAGDRTIVFVANGSVVSSDDVTLESGFQIAGVALDASSSGSSNAPMVMLQISI